MKKICSLLLVLLITTSCAFQQGYQPPTESVTFCHKMARTEGLYRCSKTSAFVDRERANAPTSYDIQSMPSFDME